MIAASLVFCLWSVLVKWIVVDCLLWNLGFLIINVILAIPLIKQRMPIKFTDEESDIWRRNMFNKFLTPFQFKKLMN